jgi:hypothetical protein
VKRAGRKSAAQTPAPKSEKRFGSKVNKPKSAASKKSAEKIVFSEATTRRIKSLVSEYNSNNPKVKITESTAKAVVRRGMGAYSSSHRPTISGGAKNSRVAWGIARLHAFMRKISGSPTANSTVPYRVTKKSYVQDNDLI